MITSLATVAHQPLEALEPIAITSGAPERLVAKRSKTHGKTGGLVLAVVDSDSPGDAESYFAAALIRELRSRLPLSDVIWVKKANRTHPPQPELWADVINRADLGIAMYGGCGTCSSRTMRDAIEMQWAGIPAVAIAHEELKGAVDAMKQISRAPSTPYILVPRPWQLVMWNREETDALVEHILPQVIELTIGQEREAERVVA
jgi:hypothetical protein